MDRRPFGSREVAKEPAISWRYLKLRPANLPASPTTGSRLEFFWARNGIFHALKLLGPPLGARFLVPSYICESAVDPIIASGLHVDFYQVDRNCAVDLPDIESRITPTTVGIIVVHYFGAPQAMGRIREMCDQHKLFLIEDCAHVLSGGYGGTPLGSFGDVSVFSWRKFLPIYDGATLLLRPNQCESPGNRRESALFTLKVLVNVVERWAAHPGGRVRGAIASLLSALQRLRQQGGAPSGSKGIAPYEGGSITVDANDVSFDLSKVDLPLSRISRFLMRHSDVAAIVAARRANYRFLSHALSSIEHVRPLWGELPNEIAPWVFPVIMEDGRSILAALREAGIPAVSWSGVCHHTLVRDAYPDADHLYENLIFLPLHQDLQMHDLSAVVTTLREVLSRARTTSRAPTTSD